MRRKVGFAAVFMDVTKRGSLPGETSSLHLHNQNDSNKNSIKVDLQNNNLKNNLNINNFKDSRNIKQ